MAESKPTEAIETTGEPVDDPRPKRRVETSAPSSARPERRQADAIQRSSLSFEELFGRDVGDGELEAKRIEAREHPGPSRSAAQIETEEYYDFLAFEAGQVEKAAAVGEARAAKRPASAGIRQAEYDLQTAGAVLKSWLLG
jgi:hypothetical protein